MKRRGFTVVEIIITLTVIAILLSLGTVSLLSAQKNARDTERKSDIEVIARGLEQYYTLGNPYVVTLTKGTYPGTRDLMHLKGLTMCDANGASASRYVSGKCSVPDTSITEALPGVSSSSLAAPGLSADLKTNWFCDDSCLTSGDLAAGYYIYRPFNAKDSADPTGWCFHECPRYELWYKKESDGLTAKVKSKRQ